MSEGLLAFIIFLAFVVIAVACYFVVKSLEKRRAKKNKKAKFDDKPRLKLNLPYLSENEKNFLAVFQNSLPSDYVAFPKVEMKHIVKPNGGLVVYHEVENETLDVVVFLKKVMQPVLVVDILDPSKGEKYASKLNEYVLKSLKSVNLPVLTITLDHQVEKLELLNAFLDKMDPVALAQIQKS